MSDPEYSEELSDDDTTTKESQPAEENQGVKQTKIQEDSDHTPTPSFFEDLDQFEVGDDDIGEIGVISTNKLIQSALEGFISVKKARIDLVSSIEDKVQLEKVLNRLEKKRLRLLKYTKTAPF